MSEAPASPRRRVRWLRLLWMLSALFAVAAGGAHRAANWASQATETLLEDELQAEGDLSKPLSVPVAPIVARIEFGQVLAPIRELVTSSVSVLLVRPAVPATATAPSTQPRYPLLFGADHEFSRTADGSDMRTSVEVTIREPGTYHLLLGQRKMTYESAGGPVWVRVVRLRASAVPFQVGVVGFGALAVVGVVVAAIASAVRFVHRLRREDEAAFLLEGNP